MNKVALIDLGTSALRLLIVNVKEGGYFEVVEEIEESTKLGKEIEETGVLKPARIAESINVLKMFRRICDSNSISKIISVATSAIKNAKNQNSFLDEIYNSCGFNMTVLTQEDELKALYNGVVNTIDIPKGVVINVAPSFTQVFQYNRRTIVNYETLPVGSINLADKYVDVEDVKEKTKLMLKDVKALVNKVAFIKDIEPEIQFVGAGDLFKSVGILSRKSSRYSLDLENNYVMTADNFNGVYEFVKTLDVDKTKKLKGVSAERADAILSGMSIIKAFYDCLDIQNITISAYGVREGLIYNNIVPEVNDKPLSDMMGYSLDNIRAFKDREYSNASQVYNLAILLFKQLKVIHKLHRFYVKPLRIAASLFDCGKRIRFENSEKNSFNVILNSNINGVSQREILVAAFAGACQNLDNFNLSDWVKYKDIVTDEDLDAVRKLGTIIKLAVALDKTKAGVVKDISCDILGDSVIMKTVVEGDATFEILEGMKVGTDFRKVFKKYLEVI